ncbi:CIA30-domain-containing protein [Pseudovirgaria hyperparasitica]|uniref:CIA30-domain-containing protein n=1 Tax=Pseudovirgaria hyperparasitica TaxID=470096 RepID=A0A6A6W3U7_9PEZI|nr:CIA30-domain-containing protein [Pseudovirgaria hyperparasitica]KAF2757293.1 CIA30-domain-containing protein [Pseudovirgaria hyperparasitica]
MIPTYACLARAGFWKRTLEEAATFTRQAVTFENAREPSGPLHLINFDSPDKIEECKVMGDFHLSGFSTADLDYHAVAPGQPSHARFHGNISLELPPNRPEIQRSGFAGWRTRDQQRTLFGRPTWNTDRYRYLAVLFKSDARKYYINLQTKSIVPTDIHQHRLYAKKPGEWETAWINWDDFVRTNHGLAVEPQTEMNRQYVKSIGISIIDRVPGTYDLSIAKMWATNEDPRPVEEDYQGTEQPVEQR